MKADENSLGIGIDITLKDPISLCNFLVLFLVIHAIDYILYVYTQPIWDMWKVIHPKRKEKLRRLSE